VGAEAADPMWRHTLPGTCRYCFHNHSLVESLHVRAGSDRIKRRGRPQKKTFDI
jgi:hypothetical protein